MKSKQISVLIYGHDARLLESRKWVLQSFGYRALSVRHLAGLNRVSLTPPIDLLVLCYTLTPKECDSAIAYAKLRWPNVKELALVRYSAAREAAPVPAHVLKALDAPDPLLSMVSQLVGHSTSSSYSHIY
ncbi:MAG TPA: hypothetical protein VHU44_02505 [Acidobacteriaceae bacterium]|jgi:hypothetical protein|nr:hypothetical protein [Acidobacteriaceae bacterium]